MSQLQNLRNYGRDKRAPPETHILREICAVMAATSAARFCNWLENKKGLFNCVFLV